MAPKKTIHSTAELAVHLGLSRWAVSRAINRQDGVSAGTVARVQAAMQEFGFAPSPHGRGLRGHRTGAIGICFRALDTPITIQKIAHVQRLVSQRGFRPLFELTEADPRMGTEVINHFIAMRVEGVLLIDAPPGAECTAWLKSLKSRAIPAALLDPRGAVTPNTVYLDREAAMAEVTAHLLALGHKRFGLLGISRNFPFGKLRYDGVARALAAHGKRMPECVDILDNPEHRYQGMRYGSELAESLLRLKEKPSALLALNDEVAVGAMWSLQKAGFAFPRDFSIFGFDNLAFAEQTNPALSTVDHRVNALALSAVDMLLTLIERGPTARIPAVKIAPQVILRDSVAPAKGAG